MSFCFRACAVDAAAVMNGSDPAPTAGGEPTVQLCAVQAYLPGLVVAPSCAVRSENWRMSPLAIVRGWVWI
jgi:hypothetical protein